MKTNQTFTVNFKAEKNETCNRCNGSGYLRQFNHVEGGVCFKCRGAGTVKSYK